MSFQLQGSAEHPWPIGPCWRLTFLPLDLFRRSSYGSVCNVERDVNLRAALAYMYGGFRLHCADRPSGGLERHIRHLGRPQGSQHLFLGMRSLDGVANGGLTATKGNICSGNSSVLTSDYVISSVHISVYSRAAERHGRPPEGSTPWQEENEERDLMQERFVSQGQLRLRASGQAGCSDLLSLEHRPGPLLGRCSREPGARPPAPTLRRCGPDPRGRGAQPSCGTDVSLINEPEFACVAPSAGTSSSTRR